MKANANALAESFVDSFKTDLIADRVWRTRIQLQLSVVEYVAWFNSSRLHSTLGYRPPAEIEAVWHASTSPSRELVLADASRSDACDGGIYGPFGVVSDLRC